MTPTKIMQINNYEVLINETAAQCGLIVDLDEYNIEFLANHNLFYEVNNKNREISIFDENNNLLLIFGNLDDQLIYYSFKTVVLAIFGGKTSPITELHVTYFAQLK